jgi:glutaminyl-tRNA synthetase
MPTIAGLRRRGVTPAAIRNFAEKVGVAKTNSRVEISLLEHCIRDDLNVQAPRVMAVLRPLKLVILNYPAGQTEMLDASYWPRDVPKEGARPVPFSRELYIEQDDFMEDPPADFYRLAPGRAVRLRFAYIVQCVDVVKDPATGEVVEVHCTYEPDTKGGAAPKGRKVQGTLHWVSAAHALPAEVRLYEQLFAVPNPDEMEEGKSFRDYLNPNSKQVLARCWVEPSVADDPAGSRYQFERLGYFVSDIVDSRPGRLVFNRIIELRDSWAKTAQAKPQQPAQAIPAAVATPATGEPAEGRRSRTEVRNALRAETPELAARLTHYTQALGLAFDDADVLTGDLALARFFEEALAVHSNAKSVANWVTNEVLRAAKEAPVSSLPFTGAQLGALVALVDEGTISATVGKEVFAQMAEQGGDPRQIVAERGLAQISDPGELAEVVARVVAANPEKVAQYRGGKSGLLGFFVGQVMRETQSRANPKLAQELVQQALAKLA